MTFCDFYSYIRKMNQKSANGRQWIQVDGYKCSTCQNSSLIQYSSQWQNQHAVSGGTKSAHPFTPFQSWMRIYSVQKYFSFPNFVTKTGTIYVTNIESLVNPQLWHQQLELLVSFLNYDKLLHNIIKLQAKIFSLPPSIKENPYKTYKTFWIPNFNTNSFIASFPPLARRYSRWYIYCRKESSYWLGIGMIMKFQIRQTGDLICLH